MSRLLDQDDPSYDWKAWKEALELFRAAKIPRCVHLAHAGYRTIEEIVAASDGELLDLPMTKRKTLEQIRAAAARALHRRVCPACDGRGWLPSEDA